MNGWFAQLDRILRGEETAPERLTSGQMETPLAGLLVAMLMLAIVSGATLGAFGVIRGAEQGALQVFASAIKFPLLFVLTLVVTLPSLYVFNALIGSSLNWMSVLRLAVASAAVMLAVSASFAPIVVFFAVSSSSYPFMKLLVVVFSGISGALGLAFLLRTLQRLVFPERVAPVRTSEIAEADEPAAPIESIPGADDVRAVRVFRVWVAVFGLVGAQMAWVLRPFIGSPALPFAWFRPRESNFFVDVLRSITELLGG
ncbi:MAG: hypothetical protein AAF430_00700 [Myxococcota bacterium]